MMSGRTVVGFRDSAYLYYPLFQWIDAQWAAGEIPLWNPYCNFGMPVVGDGTSSVFYPGKLVFFCRFLSFPARYGIYLALHIPLAGAGAYWFARTLRANQAGATLAAFSYAFGGSVLFQVTNVIYLVSAAWLPFALCCVWRMVKTGQYRWSIGAGVCCALMILGGDPQMVYHVGLIAVATIFSEFLRRRRRRQRNRDRSQLGAYRWAFGSVTKLGLMIAVTTMLALVQLLPTYDWSKQSERTNPESVVNVYGAFSQLMGWEKSQYNLALRFPSFQDRPIRASDLHARDMKESLFGPPLSGTVTDHAYQFSQPPWSITELFWPNVSGKMFPIHKRWIDALPGADRVWVPSIYIGLLTILIALHGFRLWGRRRRNVWLTRVGLFFAIASFGWYGSVWLIYEMIPSERQITEIGPQVGSIYWAMVMVLPKYFAFRYPAKLFVIASLAISLLAEIRLRSYRPVFSTKSLAIYCLLTVAGLAAILPHVIYGFFPADRIFGPFNAEGCQRELVLGFSQAMIIIGFSVIATRWSSAASRGPIVLWVLVVLTVADLMIANRWLLAEVPSSAFTGGQLPIELLSREFGDRADNIANEGPLTIHQSRETKSEPLVWSAQGSEDRLEEVLSWQQATLFPKHHLEHQVRLVGSFSSIWPAAYQSLLSNMEFFNNQPPEPRGGTREVSTLTWIFCDGELIKKNIGDEFEIKIHKCQEGPRFAFLTKFDREVGLSKNLLRNLNTGEFAANQYTELELQIVEICQQRGAAEGQNGPTSLATG